MKYVWEDLPEKKNCFTVRNATMRDLRSNKVIQYYSANVKIVVVQKCITENNTYYRTRSAAERGLDWAFEASAFGLPNEAAPSAPRSQENSSLVSVNAESGTRTHARRKKQTSAQTVVLPEDGEARQPKSWLKRLFRRYNG